MTTFNIIANGTDLGNFEGATADEAVETYARDAGYKSYAHLASELGKSTEEACEELEVVEMQPAFAIQFKNRLGTWDYYGSKRDCTFADRAEAERVLADLEAEDAEGAEEASEWRIEEAFAPAN